jgi:hypothetical protein
MNKIKKFKKFIVFSSCFSFFILKKEELSDFCSDAKAKAKGKMMAKP